MFKKLSKGIRNPQKAWRFLLFFLKHFFRKRRGILVIIGVEPNGLLSLMHWGYKVCYGFEANPERYKKLIKGYGKYKYIKLFNVAVAQYDGEIMFNISNNNDGASSSIGTFKEEWEYKYDGKKIEMIKSIRVPCINILNFCKENNIHFIDDYISDIQGMDLEVLKTMKPMIDEKKIGTITCEVAKNDKINIYKDLPDNSEKGFEELLKLNYMLIAKGWGALKDNTFDKIPDDAWEMDCKWKLKTSN